MVQKSKQDRKQVGSISVSSYCPTSQKEHTSVDSASRGGRLPGSRSVLSNMLTATHMWLFKWKFIKTT